MNVKKMTTEHLQDTISSFKVQDASGEGFRFMSPAEEEFVNACKKELSRRWGIRG